MHNFSKIITDTFGGFFVACQIEPIAEYLRFIRKLKAVKRITKLDASVHPPNPLFGRLWDSLRKYLKERELRELSLKEQARRDGMIKSTLLDVLKDIASAEKGDVSVHSHDIPVGDAAVLMADDGYGRAKIEGPQYNHTNIRCYQELQIRRQAESAGTVYSSQGSS